MKTLRVEFRGKASTQWEAVRIQYGVISVPVHWISDSDSSLHATTNGYSAFPTSGWLSGPFHTGRLAEPTSSAWSASTHPEADKRVAANTDAVLRIVVVAIEGLLGRLVVTAPPS